MSENIDDISVAALPEIAQSQSQPSTEAQPSQSQDDNPSTPTQEDSGVQSEKSVHTTSSINELQENTQPIEGVEPVSTEENQVQAEPIQSSVTSLSPKPLTTDALSASLDRVELQVIQPSILDDGSSEPLPGDNQNTDIIPYATNDDAVFQSTLTRVISSPEPNEESKKSYQFVNIETTEVDLDNGIVMGTQLSRSASAEPVQQQETDQVVEEIDFIRPSSPSSLSTTKQAETEEEQGTKESTENPQTDGEINTIQEAPVVEQEPVPVINREDLLATIKAQLESRDRCKSKNQSLQNRLVEYFKKKRTDETHEAEKSTTEQETRYANSMGQIRDIRKDSDQFTVNNEKIVQELKGKLQEKKVEIQQKASEFSKFRREIASSAENSRTGYGLSNKTIDQLEALEDKKENEVIAVRLENIKLRNKLRRHEQMLRQKEELADGLHLIDFEQLKIENQTFNEKIEERNEELLKLRKKITSVVQVLTHVKEKLQFVQEENGELKLDLGYIDQQVSTYRDSLPSLKSDRDVLRGRIQTLRDRNGLMGNVPLLRDFEDKMNSSKNLKSQIDKLKEHYHQLNRESKILKRKIQKVEWMSEIK